MHETEIDKSGFHFQCTTISQKYFLVYLFFFIFVLTFLLQSSVYGMNHIDTLLQRGDSCLTKSDFQCAKSNYVQAHLKGMSQDSLCYIIANLYIVKGSYDTALVYNFACKTTYPEFQDRAEKQRKLILDTLNQRRFKKLADTIQKENQIARPANGLHVFGMNASLSQNTYQSSTDFISLQTKSTFSYEDPTAIAGVFDNHITDSKNQKFIISIDLSLNSVFSLLQSPPLDRNFQGVFGSVITSIQNKKYGWRLSNSFAASYNFKEKAYYNISPSLSFPFKRKNTLFFLNIPARVQLNEKLNIIDGRAGCNVITSRSGNGIFRYGGIFDVAFNWRPPTNIIPIRIGYTDTIITDQHYTFYYDKECKQLFDTNSSYDVYWRYSTQKIWWVHMPAQNFSNTIGLNGMVFLKKYWNIGGSLSMNTKLFSQKTTWYTINNIIDLKDDLLGQYSLLYEKSSGYYHSHVPVGSPSDYGNLTPVTEFAFHSKRRLDGTLYGQLSIQRSGSRYGNISFSVWGSQTFSSLQQYKIPIPIPRSAWGISTEYKPILFVKKNGRKI